MFIYCTYVNILLNIHEHAIGLMIVDYCVNGCTWSSFIFNYHTVVGSDPKIRPQAAEIGEDAFEIAVSLFQVSYHKAYFCFQQSFCSLYRISPILHEVVMRFTIIHDMQNLQ